MIRKKGHEQGDEYTNNPFIFTTDKIKGSCEPWALDVSRYEDPVFVAHSDTFSGPPITNTLFKFHLCRSHLWICCSGNRFISQESGGNNKQPQHLVEG